MQPLFVDEDDARAKSSDRPNGRSWWNPWESGDSLPPSNPEGWPNPTAEALAARPRRIVKVGLPQIFSFADNNVKTSKYSFYDFLPKFLLEEFNPRTKIANCYFLLISGLQCLPFISNTGGIPTTLLPLTVVVTVDALFQLFEDLKRHHADYVANSSPTFVLRRDLFGFEQCQWSDLRVGDVVRVANREIIPADILILQVAPNADGTASNGLCYVETKSLDGETNLKIRSALSLTKQLVSWRPCCAVEFVHDN